MMRAYLGNPGETGIVAALALAGLLSPWAAVAAAVLFGVLEIRAGVRGGAGPRWWPSRWPVDPKPVSVLYDDTCNLCLASVRRLKSWPTSPAMTFVPVRSDEAAALAPSLPEKDRMGSMHVVEEGAVHSASDAWFRLMRLAPIEVALPASAIPRSVARPLYAWIARNRYHWFGRRCTEDGCALPGAGR